MPEKVFTFTLDLAGYKSPCKKKTMPSAFEGTALTFCGIQPCRGIQCHSVSPNFKVTLFAFSPISPPALLALSPSFQDLLSFCFLSLSFFVLLSLILLSVQKALSIQKLVHLSSGKFHCISSLTTVFFGSLELSSVRCQNFQTDLSSFMHPTLSLSFCLLL